MGLNWAQSEIIIKFKNTYSKSVIYLEKKIKRFTIFQLNLKDFVIKTLLVYFFAYIRFELFWVQVDRHK